MIVKRGPILHDTTPARQHGREPFHNHLPLRDPRAALQKPVMLQGVLNACDALLNAQLVPPVASTQFRVDRGNALIRRCPSKLAIRPPGVQDIADTKDTGQFHARLVDPLPAIDAHPHLVNHRPYTPLMQVDAVISLPHRTVEEAVRNPLTGGPVPPAREAPVHLLAVHGTGGLAGVERVDIDNRHGDHPTVQLRGIQTAQNTPDHGQTVQLIAITHRLQVDRESGLCAIYQRHRQPNGCRVLQLTYFQVALAPATGFGLEVFHLKEVRHLQSSLAGLVA